jgi:hypothetical protein
MVVLDLSGLSLAVLVHGMQQVETCGRSPSFGYKGKPCEPQLVLAIGVRLVSL